MYVKTRVATIVSSFLPPMSLFPLSWSHFKWYTFNFKKFNSYVPCHTSPWQVVEAIINKIKNGIFDFLLSYNIFHFTRFSVSSYFDFMHTNQKNHEKPFRSHCLYCIRKAMYQKMLTILIFRPLFIV